MPEEERVVSYHIKQNNTGTSTPHLFSFKMKITKANARLSSGMAAV